MMSVGVRKVWWGGRFLAQRECAGREDCPRTGWQGRLGAPEEARKMEERGLQAQEPVVLTIGMNVAEDPSWCRGESSEQPARGERPGR